MAEAVFAIAGFSFGLCLMGGLIDDGFIRPMTGYWIGLPILAVCLVAIVGIGANRACRYSDISKQEKAPE